MSLEIKEIINGDYGCIILDNEDLCFIFKGIFLSVSLSFLIKSYMIIKF